jgi:RNA polymerase sigma-70 factor (ECF subfamily)
VDEKEKQLLADCLRHKADAQRQLYERYKVQMYRLCLRYAGNSAEAEDLLQEGFIRVFSDLHQFRGEGALGGWIRQVVLRTALQYLRKRMKEAPIVSEDLIPDSLAMATFPDEDWDARQIVHLLQQLPEGYRTVFNLFVIEEYSHKEIADMLQISESTSKTQLFKAKAHLRRHLEKASVN